MVFISRVFLQVRSEWDVRNGPGASNVIAKNRFPPQLRDEQLSLDGRGRRLS